MSIYKKQPGLDILEHLGELHIQNSTSSAESSKHSQSLFETHCKTKRSSACRIFESEQKRNKLQSCLEWSTSTRRLPTPSIGARCFGNEDNTIPLEKVDSILVSETTNNFKVNLSKTFMEKGSNRGVKYVYPVEKISPTNKKLWVQF